MTNNQAGQQSTGLTPQQKVALNEAAGVLNEGGEMQNAIAVLTGSGMPRPVAKMLLRQQERTSRSALLRNALPTK